jgi:hypothetical protein
VTEVGFISCVELTSCAGVLCWPVQESKSGHALLRKVKVLTEENEDLGRQQRESKQAAQVSSAKCCLALQQSLASTHLCMVCCSLSKARQLCCSTILSSTNWLAPQVAVVALVAQRQLGSVAACTDTLLTLLQHRAA